ncbi:MAG: xanthine dehydrogenase family protein subunit M [Candidatus Krumholzibacteriia bacterium]
MFPNFSYLKAKSVEDAAHQTTGADVHVMSGGTDLLGCLRDGVFPASRLVSLKDLDELRRIRQLRSGRNGDGLGIGALVTISRVATDRDVSRRFPVLAQAAQAVASPQLRNQGTLGGNLCQKPRCWYYRGEFPCVRRGGAFCSAMDGQNQFHCILGGDACVYVHPSDTAPALTALDATVAVAGPRGDRTVPVGEFFVPPADDPTRETVLEAGEIVTEILVPGLPSGARSSYRKVRSRGAWDFAVVSTALVLDLDGGQVRDARVVLGGVAPVPWRSEAAEAELNGRALTTETARRAAEAAVADAQPLEHNAAKVDIARGVLETELLKLKG